MTASPRTPYIVVGVLAIVLLLLIVLPLLRGTGDTLTVGAIVPLTGENAVYGVALRNGMDVALDQINAAGGISGKRLAIAYEDDQAVPQQSLTAFQRLAASHSPPLIIGAMFSACTLAIAPQAKARDIILLSPTSSAVEITKLGNHVFRIYPSDTYDGDFLARVAIDDLQASSAATIFLNLTSTKQVAEVFSERFQQLGGSVLAEDGYNEGQRDFRTHLLKATSLKPDVVFLPGYLTEIALLLRQARELGLTARFITISSFYDTKAIELAGDAANGVVFSAPYYNPESSDPLTRAFVTEFRRRHGDTPNVWAGYGYDVVRVAAEALRSDPGDVATIRSALESLKEFPGVTGAVTFDEHGDVQKQLQLLVVDDGAFTPF